MDQRGCQTMRHCNLALASLAANLSTLKDHMLNIKAFEIEFEQKVNVKAVFLGKEKIFYILRCFFSLLSSRITMQRYTQIVTGRYARCVNLVFVFTMLIH